MPHKLNHPVNNYKLDTQLIVSDFPNEKSDLKSNFIDRVGGQGFCVRFGQFSQTFGQKFHSKYSKKQFYLCKQKI